MSSLLKVFIIATTLAVFIYCAALAMQGDLESEIIMRDYVTAKIYILDQAQLLIQKFK